MSIEIKVKTLASSKEQEGRIAAAAAFRNCPIPDQELLANVGIFQKRQDFTKQLFFNALYEEHILKSHGVIMEFGVRWGQNLVTLNNLRGLHEPFNYNRKIIGFDTFSGFPSVDQKDGNHTSVHEGSFAVTENYKEYLDTMLSFHEGESPLSHIKKNTLVQGDAVVELKKYLAIHPETIIAFAWFDFDIYEPTLECLKMIRPYLSKGSVVGFDELNDPGFPGETVALKEVFGLNNIQLRRNKFSGMQSYFVLE